jgi:hypothetical protein
MSMKLLPASVNPVDSSQAPDVSNSIVPLAQGAITVRAGQVSVATSADAFTSSSRSHRAGANWIDANWIDATPVEDAQSDEAGRAAVEYVSGWTWSSPIELTAIAHYLFYAAGLAKGRGWLVDLYA